MLLLMFPSRSALAPTISICCKAKPTLHCDFNFSINSSAGCRIAPNRICNNS
jgi:hypothetical protein